MRQRPVRALFAIARCVALAVAVFLTVPGLAAAGSSAPRAPRPVPDVFSLRLLNAEVFGGSVFRGWVQVYNPYDQRRLAGVTVRLEIEIAGHGGDDADADGTRTFEGRTDERGEWAFEVDLETGSRWVQLEVTARASYRGQEREVYTWAVSETAPRVILSSDKRLYQPGQTLHVRGLWLDAADRARAGEPVRLEIHDPRGRQVWRRQLTTSRFGIASAEWRIPDSAASGDYRLEANGESIGFRVSRYEMARFGLEVAVARPFHLPGQDAEMTLKVTEVDGRPIAGAAVWLDPDDASVPAVSARTDEDGRAVLTVDLSAAQDQMPEDGYRQFIDVSVEVTATDPLSGRSERTASTLRVSKQPIHVYHSGSLTGKASQAWVATFYPDGEPAACTVEVRTEHGQTLARFVTGAHGIARLPLTPAIAEALDAEELDRADLELVVWDTGGRRARREVDDWRVRDEAALVVSGRTLYPPAEPLEVTVTATEPMERVIVELTGQGGTLARRMLPRIEAAERVVFSAADVPTGALRGLLGVRAYPLDLSYADFWGEIPVGVHPVLYPDLRPLSLRVATGRSGTRAAYRPGETARLAFNVEGAEAAAIGVAVVDRGIELRQAGENLPGPALLSGLRRWGEKEVAGWTLSRLRALEPAGMTPDLDLVAAYLLFDTYPYGVDADIANPFGDEHRQHEALFKRQFAPIEAALDQVLTKGREPTGRLPRDPASFRRLLGGVDADALRDPWETPYRIKFVSGDGDHRAYLRSAGLDRTWATLDDFNAWGRRWPYFQPLGAAVDRAVTRFFRRTGDFLEGEADLARELTGAGVDWSEVRDPWGRPYELSGHGSGGWYHLTVSSLGPSDPEATSSSRRAGKEVAWTSRLNWGNERENTLRDALARWLDAGKSFPADAGEVRAALAAADLDLETWRDPQGQPLIYKIAQSAMYRDRIHYPTPESAPRLETVTERYDEIHLLSVGEDGLPGTVDDQVVGRLSRMRGEREPLAVVAPVLSRGHGAVGGTVVDDEGAVLPGATVTVLPVNRARAGHDPTELTDEHGTFRLVLAPGAYQVKVQLDGFTTVLFDLVQVVADSVTRLSVVLPVAEITEELVVTSMASLVSTGASLPRPTPPLKSTPRVRREFPETLLWLPELTTTRDGGGGGMAEVSVQLADALTTWKLAAMASTPDGRVAVAEAEIPVTQPFSVEPDLPPLMTVGDQIDIPVYLHNRSPRALRAELAMPEGADSAPAARSLGVEPRRPIENPIALDAGEARRIDMPLRFPDAGPAVLHLEASGSGVADAVRRAAVVRPAGYPHAVVHAALLGGGRRPKADLEFEVSHAALADSARLEVNVDADVGDHLTNALRGLARRPTGCAEQRTSLAFLNLMLLRREQLAGRSGGADAVRARGHLELARDSLANHVASGGGFAYWPGADADVALTAYVLDLLNQIKVLGIEVDPALGDGARRWLLDAQQEAGDWPTSRLGHPLSGLRITAWVASVLSRWTGPGSEQDATAVAVGRALDRVERRLAWLVASGADDPYTLAHATLAAHGAGRLEMAAAWTRRLTALAREQGGAAYWQLESHTPFYGWGAGGRLETTAAAVEALLQSSPEDPLARRGLTYLLLEKDADGLWRSTQATVRTLHALTRGLPAWAAPRAAPSVLLDGEPWSPESSSDPMVSGALSPGRHRLSLQAEGVAAWTLMRATVRSVVPWERLRDVVADSPSLRFQVECGMSDLRASGATSGSRASGATSSSSASGAELEIRVGRPVVCQVEVERLGFSGRGMLIAEIGLPPGADVDRGSLDRAIESSRWAFQRYEIQPDRVVAYLWPRAGGYRFEFTWRPRLTQRAAAAPSLLYDYYNPDARVVLEPGMYHVRGGDTP